MKLLGIVGGTGPESTIDYYRALIESWRARTADDSYPRMVISSINLTRMVDLITANDLAGVAAFLAEEVRRLAAAGAEVGLIAANTPHIVFDDVRRLSPIPLISIVEETCRAAVARGLRKVALLGTRFTMRGRFYPEVFDRAGIELVVPSPEVQEQVHDKYMNQLVVGDLRNATRDWFIALITELRERSGIEAVILGGTELSLILREPSYGGVAVLDTTRIHVESAVEAMLDI
ncbi:MAG TPA: amino acid racemase [Thermoanaerobaculia bacterium]|nr:amino acid racemase [Thermoanaerobaculia bacterium]